MGYYFSLVIRLGAILGCYTLLRLLFYAFNSQSFASYDLVEWIQIIYGGLRFDISAILIINSIYILVWLLPFQLMTFKKISKPLSFMFLSLNGFAMAIHTADLVFYPFNGKRIDSEVFGLLSALPSLLGSFVSDYWYIFPIFLFFVLALLRLNKYVIQQSSMGLLSRIMLFVIGVGLLIIGMRGGVTNSRPLSPSSASLHIHPNDVALVTNSPYTLIYSWFTRSLEVPTYFKIEKLSEIVQVEKELLKDAGEKPKNIVLLIMESFSKQYFSSYTGNKGYTPNLDSIFNHGIRFTNAFANGRRSSQALVALNSGIPALMNEPYLYSSYAGNNINGIPLMLTSLGYKTAFFNGSSRDMLKWEEFIKKVGYQEYYSKETYNYPEHDDGHWGIYDHRMLEQFTEVIDTTLGPFFYTFFSLSSHHPFHVPTELVDSFDSPNPFFKSMMYADWSIGEFFKSNAQKKWFKNTIFIITADHTLNGESFSNERQKNASSWYQNRVGLYAVPLAIIDGAKVEGDTIEIPFSHVDVSATILDYANYRGKFVNWGTPISKLTEDNMVIHFVNGIYQILDKDHVMLFDSEKVLGLYNYKIDPALVHNLAVTKELEPKLNLMENRIKAYIQQHHTRVSNNRMFLRVIS